MAETWTTIESDPGVFTELVEQMGVKGVQVEELYSLDLDMLREIEPIYGLIFLFKWTHEKNDTKVDKEIGNKVYFASQVINNACATQAIVSILMNCPHIDLGDNLKSLKDFTSEFPPELKGLSICNCESIRRAHNSFSRPEPFVMEDRSGNKSDDLFHFVSYVPIDGTLFELDGLKEGPINLGPCSDDDWLQKVCPIIEQRIEKYSRSEIRFNLMALVKNRKQMFLEQIEQLNLSKDRVERRLEAISRGESDLSTLDEGYEDSLPDSVDELEEMSRDIKARIQACEEGIRTEEDKMTRWKEDNIRRKHNYIPFLFNFLKILAEKKQLKPLIEKARQKV